MTARSEDRDRRCVNRGMEVIVWSIATLIGEIEDTYEKLKDSTEEELKARRWTAKVLSRGQVHCRTDHAVQSHDGDLRCRSPCSTVTFASRLVEEHGLERGTSPLSHPWAVCMLRRNLDRLHSKACYGAQLNG